MNRVSPVVINNSNYKGVEVDVKVEWTRDLSVHVKTKPEQFLNGVMSRLRKLN